MIQDTLFFLKTFFMDLAGKDEGEVSPRPDKPSGTQQASSVSPPPPVMCVNKEPVQEAAPEPQNLLMQFDELTHDLQVKKTTKS